MSETPSLLQDWLREKANAPYFAAYRGDLLSIAHALDSLHSALTAERAALQAAQEELQEESAIRERIASLLSATAIALKGQEGELRRHGWHDLPDIATKLKLACDISEALLQAERAARERAEAERDALCAENDTLRGLLGNSGKPCAHCGLPVERWGKCAHGFPGCARADDAQLSDLFAVRAELLGAEALRIRAEAERDTLLARIRDNALAMTCQSIGQYRTALLSYALTEGKADAAIVAARKEGA